MKLASSAIVLLLASASSDETVVSHKHAIKKFRAAFHRSRASVDAKVNAVKALAVHRHPEVVRELSAHMTRGPIDVRIWATRLMRNQKGVEGVSDALVRALTSPRNAGKDGRGIRITALQQLAVQRARASARYVDRFFKSRDGYEAKAAIDASALIRSRTSIEPLIGLLREIEGPAGNGLMELDVLPELPGLSAWKIIRRELYEGRKPSKREVLRGPILDALKLITRKSFANGLEWARWWRENGEAFRVPD